MSRLIDADALIPDYLVPTTTNNTPCKRYVSMEQIHNAPTIEPERKGKWIEKGGKHICSSCGSGYGNAQLPHSFNYCPNCGSYNRTKMGKWIPVEKGVKVWKYQCSECNRTVWEDRGYDVVTDYPYCHCGVKMEVEG